MAEGSPEHLDVLIVGAGLSGIGAAWHLQERCPSSSYAILEAREDLGGTWDLFRYPGIRSDSDMHTLGYRFKPWTAEKSITDGPSILEYVRETARENGIEGKIRYRHRVVAAEWSSERARWTVEAEREDGERLRADLRLPLGLQRLLPLRRRVHAAASRARSASPARSSTRSTGRRTSTTPASGWS